MMMSISAESLTVSDKMDVATLGWRNRFAVSAHLKMMDFRVTLYVVSPGHRVIAVDVDRDENAVDSIMENVS